MRSQSAAESYAIVLLERERAGKDNTRFLGKFKADLSQLEFKSMGLSTSSPQGSAQVRESDVLALDRQNRQAKLKQIREYNARLDLKLFETEWAIRRPRELAKKRHEADMMERQEAREREARQRELAREADYARWH